MHDIAAWSNFYVITGSAAAALTGLMFVVITLVAGQERTQTHLRDGVETFSSPTVVHFCGALLLSAILSAPWESLVSPAIMLGLTGGYGVAYAMRVALRMSRQSTYTPGFDDWFFYALMPLLAYAGIFGAAIFLAVFPRQILFAFGACAMLLIFLGIRNAWDTVTFVAVIDKPAATPAEHDGSALREKELTP
jgi:hypothetical protein